MSKKIWKKRVNGKALKQVQLQTLILDTFRKDKKTNLNAVQLIAKLKIKNSKDSVNHALQTLTEKKKLRINKNGKYYLLDNSTRKAKKSKVKIEGKVDMMKSGSAYILSEMKGRDIYVPETQLKTAMHGDTVLVEVNVYDKKRPDGRVLEVLKRASTRFIGRFEKYGNLATVSVRTPKMQFEINVGHKDVNQAKSGDVVEVEIIKYTKGQNNKYWGKVCSIFDSADLQNTEMMSILVNNGFSISFPEEVEKEMLKITEGIDAEEINKRRDFRDVITLTIDPDTAKDFDDALSIHTLENGDIEVGVHIADVSHYVKENTALDKEALQRSTSVYLVDRVCPMLPEKLSNDLCSLRPNEDKLCFSAVFTFDKKYNITNEWFGKTIIHSDKRFTYEEAQACIEGQESEFSETILNLNKIAFSLREKKFKNGAIAFHSDEVKFVLDEENHPVDLYVKESKEAHVLIEDFMLLANRSVAKYIAKKDKKIEIPFVYRVHDTPDPAKLEDFALFASVFGLKLDMSTPKKVSESFNELAKSAQENNSLKVLESLAIRTMAKAAYTTENIGHYGLAFEYYTHFTSPIRRYSDVLVHRILQKNLEGIFRTNKNKLEEKCSHISLLERKAMEAERESIKYMQAVYSQRMIGQTVEGVITGIIERGVFVEINKSKAEGFISFDQMGEPYSFNGNKWMVKAKFSGRTLKMGDKLKVRIESVDLAKRQIDLKWVEEDVLMG